jgi:hypothetical protein
MTELLPVCPPRRSAWREGIAAESRGLGVIPELNVPPNLRHYQMQRFPGSLLAPLRQQTRLPHYLRELTSPAARALGPVCEKLQIALRLRRGQPLSRGLPTARRGGGAPSLTLRSGGANAESRRKGGNGGKPWFPSVRLPASQRDPNKPLSRHYSTSLFLIA